jgi:NADPH:quinone reductase-like Zn-dependent oxidoreductase
VHAIQTRRQSARSPPSWSPRWDASDDNAVVEALFRTAKYRPTLSNIRLISYSLRGPSDISGGAGGVGTFAIQIAKWLSAHVTTTASKRGEALVRALGADEVIDYTTDDLSRIGKDFDAGLDLIGGATLDKMFKIMKPRTRIVPVAAVPEPQTARLGPWSEHASGTFRPINVVSRVRARSSSRKATGVKEDAGQRKPTLAVLAGAQPRHRAGLL